jgi:hypothetical protein
VTALTEQEGDWINGLATRLRLIQADAASMPVEKRREYLQEEVGRNFKGVPAANHKRYIEALIARFPVGGQIVKSPPIAAPAPAVPAAVDETPEEILERLIKASAKLSDQQRTGVSRRLAEAGFNWVDQDALTLEISNELRQKLGLQDDQQPHLRRLVELLIFLVKAFYDLERTGLITLSELSPKSPLLKRSQDFRHLATRFLTGEDESIEPNVRAISGLLGSLLAAMLGGGKELGRQYIAKYSPAEIEAVVVTEGVSFFSNKKELCWDKYVALSKDIATSDLIDRWTKECLGRFVDSKANSGR